MKDDPKWLSEMREHHSETGEYRSEDVYRVLGDQRIGLVVDIASSDLSGTPGHERLSFEHHDPEHLG